MTMNLPNKLTILRICLIVPFVIFLLIPDIGNVGRYLALGIFIVASLTDMADGKIARKYNLVTNFGKFMDPLADKLLVSSAMIILVQTGQIPSWIVILIISREFIISGFRLVASDKGVVIAAGYWGKFKTVVQMVMVMVLILNFDFRWYQIVSVILIYLALALTIISLVEYLKDNWQVLKDEGEDTSKGTGTAAPVEEIIGQQLIEKKLSLSTAESCTGGMLAGRLVNVSGISEVFQEGFVTYSNEAKEKLLGVPHDTLETYGAVSQETALEMAEGCRKAAGADIGIGITGIAGPGGGTPEKPVGLVYIGCSFKGNVKVEKNLFTGDRKAVREQSVAKALELLQTVLG